MHLRKWVAIILFLCMLATCAGASASYSSKAEDAMFVLMKEKGWGAFTSDSMNTFELRSHMMMRDQSGFSVMLCLLLDKTMYTLGQGITVIPPVGRQVEMRGMILTNGTQFAFVDMQKFVLREKTTGRHIVQAQKDVSDVLRMMININDGYTARDKTLSCTITYLENGQERFYTMDFTTQEVEALGQMCAFLDAYEEKGTDSEIRMMRNMSGTGTVLLWEHQMEVLAAVLGI